MTKTNAGSVFGFRWAARAAGAIAGVFLAFSPVAAGAQAVSKNATFNTRLHAVGNRLLTANAEKCAESVNIAATQQDLAPQDISVEQSAEQLRAARTRCAHRFVVSRDRSLNAWADGRTVAVTGKMIRFAGEDDALAFVVAHEMAHNILRHAERLRGVPSEFADADDAARVKQTEMEADALAVELVVRAGFDPEASKVLLGRMMKVREGPMPITYPSIAQRIALVDRAISDLKRP
jgi:Zn-dependent protease with chaperone function